MNFILLLLISLALSIPETDLSITDLADSVQPPEKGRIEESRPWSRRRSEEKPTGCKKEGICEELGWERDPATCKCMVP